MESIIENYSMDRLSRLYIQLEKYETEIADIERDLADFEGKLERFQPKIDEMNAMTHKPHRDFHSYHQSKAYNDYQDYLAEKAGLERNIQNHKDKLEERNKKKRSTEEKIREIITDSKTLQSVPLFRMASRNPLQKDPVKDTKYTLHPLQRLNAHGPIFRGQFMKYIEELAGVHRESGGRRRTRKRRKV